MLRYVDHVVEDERWGLRVGGLGFRGYAIYGGGDFRRHTTGTVG